MIFPHFKNIQVIEDIRPFDIALGGITPSTSFANYLFLNIIKDNKQIAEIHKKLYSGILEELYPAWLNNCYR